MKSLLEQAWYQQAAWLKLLRPLSTGFTYLARRRRDAFRGPEKSWVAPVPVVVVGNISVGGTGKTPIVLALIELLRAQGYKPGVVSRGYGAKPPRFPWLVEPEQRATQAGDEPLLIAIRGQVPVVIDPDRPAAVRHLLSQFDCDVVISDDGLQHYALARDIEIAVIDGVRGLGNRRCLPEGALREPPERLSDVDFILQNGNGKALQHPHAQVFQLAATALLNLNSRESTPVDAWVAERGSVPVAAIAGIGNPGRFFATLRGLGLQVEEHPFPDHHPFVAEDLSQPEATAVVMTEKDAVKCRQFDCPGCWVLQVSAILPDSFKQSLQQQLAVVQREKGNLHG
ncbi:tetraacyldisaccharide 4'-kinase [Nitrincola sp.]|uniref:tetraacyldisaccharide 4'-kinase n=1 Tax=Nitrincola sp. TaxID=1926584 RepID=UPI003A953AFD